MLSRNGGKETVKKQILQEMKDSYELFTVKFSQLTSGNVQTVFSS